MSGVLQIKENGKFHEVNYKFLQVLAENLPEDHIYDEIANDLLSLEIPSITEALIHRESITIEQYDAIWEKGTIDIKREMAKEKNFLSNLTDAQAQDIINCNDSRILIYVAFRTRYLYPKKMRHGRTGERLSGAMADTLLSYIANHKDPSVQQALFENDSTPLKFIPSLQTMINSGIYHVQRETLTFEDLPYISKLPRTDLEYTARRIEKIDDEKLRIEVGEVLLHNPDPSVRLELAQNEDAPISILKKLVKDNEPDVAAEAANTLRNLKEDSDDE